MDRYNPIVLGAGIIAVGGVAVALVVTHQATLIGGFITGLVPLVTLLINARKDGNGTAK